MNQGAKKGESAHATGEGGLSEYRKLGAGPVREIGTGYFGTHTPDGRFDPDQFVETLGLDRMRCVSIKPLQDAKLGLGGVMPAA